MLLYHIAGLDLSFVAAVHLEPHLYSYFSMNLKFLFRALENDVNVYMAKLASFAGLTLLDRIRGLLIKIPLFWGRKMMFWG